MYATVVKTKNTYAWSRRLAQESGNEATKLASADSDAFFSLGTEYHGQRPAQFSTRIGICGPLRKFHKATVKLYMSMLKLLAV